MDNDIQTETEEKEFYTEKEIADMQTELLEISGHYDCYPFTHEQAYEIKNILKGKFDHERVKRFIYDLRNVCEGAACVLDQSDYKTYKNDRKSMLALLEKCSDLLNTIRNGSGICNLSTFNLLNNFNMEGSDKKSELSVECQEMAATTGNLLSILIRKLKALDDSNEQRIKGRPSADDKGIVAEIAKLWETCFDKKPTQYMGGPFAEVVQIVLKGLNLPYEYPERKIHAALNNR